MTKRLLLSILVVLGVVALVSNYSSAFFNDTETSKNNTFQAGAIDLLVDNESYYNNQPSEKTSWTKTDLTNQLFFNFDDIKPGDRGEDTISLHVNDNNAWACMNINITKDDDNTCNEPEKIDDATCLEPNDNLKDGELGGLVNFIFWADDGDNVLETGENVFKEGTATALLNNDKWTIADSTANIWGTPGPLAGSKTFYIGKAWCFGKLTKAPLLQDDKTNVVSPASTTGGILCDGANINNAAQTDILMADVNFEAIQHRNNPNFVCGSNTPPPSIPPSPEACVRKPDIMLVLDRSGSIDSGELTTLKTASKAFVDAINPSVPNGHVGMVSFSTVALLNNHLTDNGTLVKNQIDLLTSTGFTNLYDAISKADLELANSGDGHDRADLTSPDFMVIVTDGEPNRPLPSNTAATLAANAATTAKANGVTVYVVGIGVTGANETYLKTQIASDAAHYFSSADYLGLQTELAKIANCPTAIR